MTDEDDLRDRFAAAALTGLTHPEDGQAGPLRMELVCTMAYRWADAMLRERSRAGQNSSEGTGSAAKCTERDSANHDAAPAARARTNAAGISRQGTGDTTVTEPMPKKKRAEVSVSEPVAWAVMERDGFGIEGTFTDRDEAAEWCDNRQQIVPLYRQPPCQVFSQKNLTLTNAERDAIERSAAAWETDARMGLSDGGVAVTLRGLLERTR